MATRVEILAFSCDELYTWLLTDLKDEVGDESIEEFRFQRINGKAFLELTDDLRDLVPLVGERKAIQLRINSFKPKVLILGVTLFLLLDVGWAHHSVARPSVIAAFFNFHTWTGLLTCTAFNLKQLYYCLPRMISALIYPV